MKLFIKELLKKKLLEGANTRHNGGNPENDKAFDPNARADKEKNIRGNYVKIKKLIDNAKNIAKEEGINTNPSNPNNDSVFTVKITSHGQVKVVGVETTNKDINKVGEVEVDDYGNMSMYVSSPKRFDHPHDLPEPVIRTNMASPAEEAKIKALVHFESDIMNHFTKLFGFDNYEDKNTPEYADSKMDDKQKARKIHMDNRDAVSADKKDNSDALKRIKSNFESLIPYVNYVGGEDSKAYKVGKKTLVRDLNAIKRYGLHWVPQEDLIKGNVRNHTKIGQLKRSILRTLTSMNVKLGLEGGALPVMLKRLFNQLNDENN